jgi:murein DD-endopeptidase MepM/ murein hydrolase activator NlpD
LNPLGTGSQLGVAGTAGTGTALASRRGGSEAAAASIGAREHDVPGAASSQAQPGASPAPEPTSAATNHMPPAGLAGYQWPIESARITNGFGVGRPGSFLLDGQTFHDGIDLASFCGAPIVAAHDGEVLTAGRHHEAFLGWLGDLAPFRARVEAEHLWSAQAITIVIDDGNGYRSIYAHLARTAVKAGATVKSGDVIGYEGASGYATGCHLHFGVFSPSEPRTLALDPKVAARSKLPGAEVMRIDPLLVLPAPDGAAIIWGWGARD